MRLADVKEKVEAVGTVRESSPRCIFTWKKKGQNHIESMPLFSFNEGTHIYFYLYEETGKDPENTNSSGELRWLGTEWLSDPRIKNSLPFTSFCIDLLFIFERYVSKPLKEWIKIQKWIARINRVTLWNTDEQNK